MAYCGSQDGDGIGSAGIRWRPISDAKKKPIPHEPFEARSDDLLTPREREILQLIAEGKSNKEMAASLEISLYTVATHHGNLMEKPQRAGTDFVRGPQTA